MLHNLALFGDNRVIAAIEVADHIIVEKADACPEGEFVGLLTQAATELAKTPDHLPQIFSELTRNQQAHLQRRTMQGSARPAFSEHHASAHVYLDKGADILLNTAKLLRILRNMTYNGSAVIDQNEIENSYSALALPVQREGITPPGMAQGIGQGQGRGR